jgi:hypothetical protein
MTATYKWYETYKTAVLETDWSKMEERVRSAEAALQQRVRELSVDHGDTAEERQALAFALSGLSSLRKDAAAWLKRAPGDKT